LSSPSDPSHLYRGLAGARRKPKKPNVYRACNWLGCRAVGPKDSHASSGGAAQNVDQRLLAANPQPESQKLL